MAGKKRLCPLNGDQILAIEHLKKALSRLSSVGLLLADVDGTLIAFIAEGWTDRSVSPAQVVGELDYELIEHRAYYGSGGS